MLKDLTFLRLYRQCSKWDLPGASVVLLIPVVDGGETGANTYGELKALGSLEDVQNLLGTGCNIYVTSDGSTCLRNTELYTVDCFQSNLI